MGKTLRELTMENGIAILFSYFWGTEMKKNSMKQEKSLQDRRSSAGLKKRIIEKPDRYTLVVLAVLFMVFAAATLWVHSEDVFHGENDIFDPYGEETVEFEKAKVVGIPDEEIRIDEAADNAFVGSQELNVIIRSGRYKGESMTAYNYFGPYYGVPVEVNDGVTVTIKTHADGSTYVSVYELNRIPILAGFLLLFFLVVVLVGRMTGLKSMVGLILTFVCLFVILIPLLLKGAPTILTTFAACAYIALVSFTILGGVHRKTVSAFLGTLSGMLLAMVFALIVQRLAKIDGLRLEDSEPLIQLKYAGAAIRVRGLLVAGIIISALGAVMDVAISISSSLEEVYAANPSLTRKMLFKSGMNIGRDMVGTMTNTLILAFLGSEFTLMIFLYARELTFYHMFSTAFISLETISGISASIGMILAIPLTALISSALISRSKSRR